MFMNMIVLVISNANNEQLTKTVRRQPELYILKLFVSCLDVYGHIHMFHALQQILPVHNKRRRQRPLRWWEILEFQS